MILAQVLLCRHAWVSGFETRACYLAQVGFELTVPPQHHRARPLPYWMLAFHPSPSSSSSSSWDRILLYSVHLAGPGLTMIYLPTPSSQVLGFEGWHCGVCPLVNLEQSGDLLEFPLHELSWRFCSCELNHNGSLDCFLVHSSALSPKRERKTELWAFLMILRAIVQ